MSLRIVEDKLDQTTRRGGCVAAHESQPRSSEQVSGKLQIRRAECLTVTFASVFPVGAHVLGSSSFSVRTLMSCKRLRHLDPSRKARSTFASTHRTTPVVVSPLIGEFLPAARLVVAGSSLRRSSGAAVFSSRQSETCDDHLNSRLKNRPRTRGTARA